MIETITKEELDAVKEARAKLANTKIEAEKFVAIHRVADLEATNLILSIYNKYNLKSGTDSIREDGTIVREEVKNG
jgi:hypothetical protein